MTTWCRNGTSHSGVVVLALGALALGGCTAARPRVGEHHPANPSLAVAPILEVGRVLVVEPVPPGDPPPPPSDPVEQHPPSPASQPGHGHGEHGVHEESPGNPATGEKQQDDTPARDDGGEELHEGDKGSGEGTDHDQHGDH